MIENLQQYEVTKKALSKFEKALNEYPKEKPENVHPIAWQAHKEALLSQIESLTDEIKEWENKNSAIA